MYIYTFIVCNILMHRVVRIQSIIIYNYYIHIYCSTNYYANIINLHK